MQTKQKEVDVKMHLEDLATCIEKSIYKEHNKADLNKLIRILKESQCALESFRDSENVKY